MYETTINSGCGTERTGYAHISHEAVVAVTTSSYIARVNTNISREGVA